MGYTSRLVLVFWLVYGIGCGAGGGDKQLEVPKIDWKSLEFTCTHEKDRLPKPDAEADQWFKTARAYDKSGKESLEPQMLELYLKAAERDHVKALNNLVLVYLEGQGVEPDAPQAVEYAERLTKMEIGMGYYHMGVFLEQGIGVEQDRPASLAYFRRAADLGNAQGQYVVGKKLLGDFRQTPERDRIMAIGMKMLECALAQGESKAGVQLGYEFTMSGTDVLRGLAYFQKAAALGNTDALFALFTGFRDGEWGLSKNSSRAECYEKLWREAEADNKKTFPNIDRICPLPPKPVPPAGKA